MYKLFGSILISILSLQTVLGQEASHTSTVTLSVGGETPPRNVFGEAAGPAFNGNYELRIMKYLAVEAGVDTLLPKTQTLEILPVITTGTTLVSTGTLCSACVLATFPNRTRVTLVPFGVKGILPLSGGRLELFAGAGGAYAWHSGYPSADALVFQTSLGARVALDKQHHFWLGATGRFFTDSGVGRQEWVSWTADFGFRFGH